MPSRQGKGDPYTDHERTAAGRYRWWGVYLMRERRRLATLGEAVAKISHDMRIGLRPKWPMSA